MFKAILYKEFLKIKYFYIALLGLLLGVMLYLYFNIVKSFLAIEPHSMLWYEAIFIGNIYYKVLQFIPCLFAFVIALAQFLPEVYKKKFRIPLHLPINQNKMLFLYLGVGVFLLTLLNLLYLIIFYLVSSSFYPHLITLSALFNTLPWILASYILYNGLAAIMIEPFFKRRVFLSILFLLLIALLFSNNEYEAYNDVLILYIFVFMFSTLLPMLSLYRFKNGDAKLLENHTFVSKMALACLVVFSWLALSFFLPRFYAELIKNDALDSYIFYSSKEKKFVYKKHFGEHNFTYGDSLGHTLNDKQFEASLPFVYWRNLDIQKKLPITINGITYTKQTIRKARQSFHFDYKDLQQNNKQIPLYPLFNPSSKMGMIAFPNEMMNLDKGVSIYDSKHNRINKVLSTNYTRIFKEHGFLFPAKIVAGKTTNIKPLDEGYFILDAKNDLYHIKVYDDEMKLKKIHYNKNIQIKDIKISESRKKEFYGIALDSHNQLYIISYDNYNFIKLPLNNYIAQTMKLEIYANTVNKLVRYQDSDNVYAIAFDKEFNFIDEYQTSVPKINALFYEISDYFFPFLIQRNMYKSFEEYKLKLGSYKAFILSLLMALLFILLNQKKPFQERLIKALLLFVGGIYSLFFIFFI